MTTDSQTQEIPRVPKGVLAVEDLEVAEAAVPAPYTEAAVPAPDAEAAVPAPDAEGEVPAPDADAERTESVQEMYEAGMALLDAFYDRWAAAMAEIQEVQTSGEPREAAA